MDTQRKMQGRLIGAAEVALIKRLIAQNPTWHRTQLSRELCRLWEWKDQQGRIKDMACRTLLLKLDREGSIKLPLARIDFSKRRRSANIQEVEHSTELIDTKLRLLRPLQIETVSSKSKSFGLWATLLKKYHYLGFSGCVGENMKYLIRDGHGRPLAALMFGSAAWKAGPRDAFIGWDSETREVGIQRMTNNMRFLIVPWVRVPHLASHILGAISRRIVDDWERNYRHPIYMLETFVEQGRFRGTCYKAANWVHVGATQGRTRNDRHHSIQVPIKDIWLYPLTDRFRELLASCGTSSKL